MDDRICEGLYEAIELINEIPSEDIASVARGRWIHLGGDEWCCSACGFVIFTEGSWEKPIKNTARIAGQKWKES